MTVNINYQLDVADFLSLVAIIMSWIAMHKSNKVSKQIANKTLSKEFFENIFLDFMINDFPEKILEPLEMKNGKINISVEKAEKTILKILKQAKPYEYFNSDFYHEFYFVMSELEENIFNLIQLQEKGDLSEEVYEKTMCNIDELSKKIYVIMKTEYMC